MIRLPQLTKANWKKILREIDISKFPSLPSYLQLIRRKLLSKEELLFSETQLGYAKLYNYFEKYAKEINSLYIKTIDWNKFENRMPLEHQKAGVEFLLNNNRCILGDDMGLGKSITTIYAALSMESKHKVLVVTLKSLKYNFAKEIAYLSNDFVVVDKKWQEAKFTIVHYDALKKWEQQIKDGGFTIMILDEAHKVRNHKAQRTKITTSCISVLNPLKIWLLTGTPIDNRPIDYYHLLKLIKHPIAKNWVKYVERYCDGKMNRWGQWEVSGASNLEELHNLTQDVFLRRLKKNSGIELPDKVRRPIFLEMKNRKGYSQCIIDYEERKQAELDEEFGDDPFVGDFEAGQMVKLILYRQFCALEKINDGSLLESIDNILEENPTNKIIVFTNFRAVIDAVYEHIGEKHCSFIDGRILDPKRRLDIVDDFNVNPDKQVIVINMKAGGTGLNIQGANKVIVNDMDWVPSTMLQAEDRAWRIGQSRDVEVIYLIYGDTVEELVYNEVSDKMRIISTVIEGRKEEFFNGEVEVEKNEPKDERQSLLKAIFAQLGD